MDTLKIIENPPEAYPAVSGLSAQAAELEAVAIWQRIEAYIAWRWVSRPVILTVDGCGNWEPPLNPTTIDQAYSCSGSDWTPVDLAFGPLGFMLPDGLTKIEATVGTDETPPAAVFEAFRRLAEYLADETDRAGLSQYSVKVGQIEESYSRSVSWVARAMQHSGAGDLLRPYRRA